MVLWESPWSETEKYVDIPLYTSSGNKTYYFGSNNSVLGDIIMVEILATVLAIRYCDYTEHHEKMRDILEMHRLKKNEKI